MKKLLLLSLISLLFSTQSNANNLDRIKHGIQGIGCSAVFLSGLVISKAVLETIPKKNINEIKQNGLLKSEFTPAIALVGTFMGYALYKSAKGTYKNFKKAFGKTSEIKADLLLNKKTKDTENDAEISAYSFKKNRRNNRNR